MSKRARYIKLYDLLGQPLLWSISFMFLLGGCVGHQLTGIVTSPPTQGYITSVHEDLVSLPAPKGKIPVAVYSFRDLTGQYKPQANATSFSTAVTQGAASMLVQALLDSNWFVPLEREGLQNLLTERKISRATLQNGTASKKKLKKTLPSLMFAQLLIEGGIVAYETNLSTGGFGAKYFGAGGSVKYRTDRVTLYLRAVDLHTGKVLKSVTTTKTILSRGLDFGLFRFVRLKRLLEVETGVTTNEPPQMCVLEAIEKAVYDLVLEGIIDNLWTVKTVNDLKHPAILQYMQNKKRLR